MYRINNNKSGTVDLQPIKDSIAKIEQDTAEISRMLNLTTFTFSGQAMTGGSFFKMEDWLTSISNDIEIYGIGSSGTNTIGYWHTLDDSRHLITSSDLLSHTGFTDYISNGWMNKSLAINLEGKVIDSLTNIGMYPWTGTDYDGYVFKYGLTYDGLRWDMPTLPEKVKSITYSYIFTDAGVSVNPVLSFTKMNDMDYLKFDNVGNSIVSGSYVLSYNGQHVGTMDLINDSATQFSVKDVKIDELNYSALSYKPLLLTNATCDNLNIISPCSLCTLSSCELNNVNGHSLAMVSIHNPKMVSDLNIEGFNNVSLLNIESTEPQKDINFNNIAFASMRSIIAHDLKADNVNSIYFDPSTYNYNINIDNVKLNNITSAVFGLNRALGMIDYGEFNNINSLTLSMPISATYFSDGALLKNITDVYVEYGTCLNFTFDDVEKFKVYKGTISNNIGKGENLAIQTFIGEQAQISNFTFNNPDYLDLNKATIFGGELTVQELKAQTALIKMTGDVYIDSFLSGTNLTLSGMKNLTVNYAPNLKTNRIQDVEKVYFKEIPAGFQAGCIANSWYVDSVSTTAIYWLDCPYLSASTMTLYTGTNGWIGSLSTYIADNLYNTSSSGKYTIKNVNNITLNNLSFTGSNSIYINNFANLEINKINNNTGNIIYVNGQYLLQNNVKINNFEGVKTMHLDEISQLKLYNGTVSNLFVEGNSQNFGALTLSNVSMNSARFSNLSYADFGGKSCDWVEFSDVLNCVNPFSYCNNVYIDAAHSANLTNYVLNWGTSHVI